MRAVGGLLALWVCAACSSVTVRPGSVRAPQTGYSFGPVPSHWEPIEVESNDAAWVDRQSGGMIHVDHTCERSQDVPLPALVQQVLIGFTDRSYDVDEAVPFDGREARHVVVQARLDGVRRTLELYVLKKDGCVYDLGYAAPPERFAAGQPAFQAFVQGFHTTRTPLGDRR